jgi:hypothetical protein
LLAGYAVKEVAKMGEEEGELQGVIFQIGRMGEKGTLEM